jgi:hypothetical protein
MHLSHLPCVVVFYYDMQFAFHCTRLGLSNMNRDVKHIPCQRVAEDAPRRLSHRQFHNTYMVMGDNDV